MIDEERIVNIAEALDQLMTVDISARGSIGVLYQAARAKHGGPLTLMALRILEKAIKPKGYAIIATGWADQPRNVPERGESDGPPGAVALAFSLRMALKAAPLIVTDEYLVDGMKRIARAAGFHVVPPENVPNSVEYNGVPTISFLPFPLDHDSGKSEALSIMNKWKPTVCIAIERGGMNEFGRIHGMGGSDFSESQGKIDYLFRLARDKGVPTIGIGDGGNEIGMANIAETVRDKVPYGSKCRCPCGAGIAPSTPVDVVVAATISNWGAYAISALLAAKYGIFAAMNDSLKESRVLRETADADFHDTQLGLVVPSVDNCRAEIHCSMVTLMKETVLQAYDRAGKTIIEKG